MPVLRAVPVWLTASERKMLKKRGRGAKTAHRDRQRALIVLAAARGQPNARIAAGLGVSEDMVRKWRGRFAERGLPGLKDLPRSGRPRRITAAERAEVCAMACQLPAATGVPLARWSCPELAAELAGRGLTGPILGVCQISCVRAFSGVFLFRTVSPAYSVLPDPVLSFVSARLPC
jgi:transposase